MTRSPLVALSLTVFIDMLGFSIILPVLPYYALTYGASASTVGLLFASYSLMQFVFSPVWGSISDRIGRKPVLLVGLVGAGVGFVLFGVARSLVLLFLSRILAGGMAATIPVAQAYVADVTPAEDRARSMGMLGAMLGLGFIVGPALGGYLERFGTGVPAYVAAALAFGNALLTAVSLPESLHASVRSERWLPVRALHAAMRTPAVMLTSAVFFVSVFALAAMEATFGLLVNDLFYPELSPSDPELARRVGYLFAFSGVIIVIVQGGLFGRLARAMGEVRLIPAGLALMAVGLVLLPLRGTLGWLLVALAVLSLGSSLIRPTVASVLSQLVPDAVQGGILSVSQALSSLARATGPAWGGWAYHAWGYPAPFLIGGCAMALAFAGSIVLVGMSATHAQGDEKGAANSFRRGTACVARETKGSG